MQKYQLMYIGPRGFSLIEAILVLSIIGLFAAMVIPNLSRARTNTFRDRCITNLRRIAIAKENWSLQTEPAPTEVPTAEDLDPYFKKGTASVTCLLDSGSSFASSYTINDLSADPVCNIDATHTLGEVVEPPPPPPGGCY